MAEASHHGFVHLVHDGRDMTFHEVAMMNYRTGSTFLHPQVDTITLEVDGIELCSCPALQQQASITG